MPSTIATHEVSESLNRILHLLRSGHSTFNSKEEIATFLSMIEKCLLIAHEDCRSMYSRFSYMQVSVYVRALLYNI